MTSPERARILGFQTAQVLREIGPAEYSGAAGTGSPESDHSTHSCSLFLSVLFVSLSPPLSQNFWGFLLLSQQ